MGFILIRRAAIASIGLLALHGQTASATTDIELVANCREILAATEPARAVWLEKDLFAYEVRAAAGATSAEIHVYRENLIDTCGRVAQNNHRRKALDQIQISDRRQLAVRSDDRM